VSRRTVRDAWLSEVLRSPLIGDACRVLLLHMATVSTVRTKGGHPMTDTGRIKVSRDELAEALGVKPNRITNRVTEATRKGLLRKVGGGHNGQTAIYAAQVQSRRKGVGSTDTYSGPESLAGLVKVSVSQVPTHSPKPIPTPAISEPVGIGRGDNIRARASRKDREQEPAPDGSRVEPEHDVSSQAAVEASWQPPRSNRRSSDPTENVA
jgi:DNA-binding Lrp family transcriptional regulator